MRHAASVCLAALLAAAPGVGATGKTVTVRNQDTVQQIVAEAIDTPHLRRSFMEAYHNKDLSFTPDEREAGKVLHFKQWAKEMVEKIAKQEEPQKAPPRRTPVDPPRETAKFDKDAVLKQANEAIMDNPEPTARQLRRAAWILNEKAKPINQAVVRELVARAKDNFWLSRSLRDAYNNPEPGFTADEREAGKVLNQHESDWANVQKLYHERHGGGQGGGRWGSVFG